MKQDKFYAVFCYEYDGNMVEVLEQESIKKEIVFETNNHKLYIWASMNKEYVILNNKFNYFRH